MALVQKHPIISSEMFMKWPTVDIFVSYTNGKFDRNGYYTKVEDFRRSKKEGMLWECWFTNKS